jgi:predicted NUDIX family phosphoesterase
MKDENILVVPAACLQAAGVTEGLDTNNIPQKLETLLSQSLFMPRAAVETDPTYKQIIPYHLVIRGGLILIYGRTKQSGETRLMLKHSVGFGGHINEEDAGGKPPGMDAYKTGADRELFNEELHICAPTITNHMVGIINDNHEEVGEVHLGIVHVVVLHDDYAGVASKDEAVQLIGFFPGGTIEDDPDLETWSKLCITEEAFAEFRTGNARVLISSNVSMN